VYNYYIENDPNQNPHNTTTVQNVLEAVRRALQQQPQRKQQGGFISSIQNVCELRKRVCHDLMEDDTTCQNKTMCLSKCGKPHVGLNQPRYQDDLAAISQLLQTHNHAKLQDISQNGNHSY